MKPINPPTWNSLSMEAGDALADVFIVNDISLNPDGTYDVALGLKKTWVPMGSALVPDITITLRRYPDGKCPVRRLEVDDNTYEF